MSSLIGDKREVKIFVLYLLENINYPLELCTISDIVMQTDYVMFLDFAESFNEMVDDGLVEKVIEDEKEYYFVTSHGRMVAQSLKSDVLPALLDKALGAAFRYLDFARRGVVSECEVINVNAMTGECDLHCRLLEKKQVLFDATMHVDSVDRAERMKTNFTDRPEVIYRGLNSLLLGKVDFLLNKDEGK